MSLRHLQPPPQPFPACGGGGSIRGEEENLGKRDGERPPLLAGESGGGGFSQAKAASLASHSHPIRVYYEDTDAGGMVYHSNYLKFAERGRTEFLRSLGHSHTRAREEGGVAFVVRRCTVDFLVPARLDDALTVATTVVAVRGALLSLRQEIRRGDDLLAALDIDVACIGREGRAQRLPPLLRAMLLSK